MRAAIDLDSNFYEVSRLPSPYHLANVDDEQPTSHIIDAFKEYINNEIPSRLIDTSNLQFVSRGDVFRVFQDKIASVTDEQIQERIRRFHSDPLATYQPQRETVLRQIIQEIVKYDILSHRWDEIAGEPTYEDVSAGKRQASKFNKLVQFCKTSRKLGRKLAWVDTCCIDKTNAAELSEAIHGMYKWYANSYLCIVHLAESTSYADWDSESWFTRGWTLQELLAPRRLKFYDKNWRPFTSSTIDDDRKSVDEIHPLESITGISKAVLTADNSQGVQGRNFWEIMSWASKRQTTLVEDRAYCLVGFFRVSLTIAYGEGQRAFSRLFEVVAAKNPSWEMFAWFGQPSVDHFALPSSPASYPAFEADMGKNRVGVQKFTITAHGLSLKSLPPVPMEFCSVVQPEVPGKPFLVSLKPRSNNESCSGRYGDLVVECGATRFITIRDARQLSACVINHHAARNREQGKLMVGKEYICFLLYSEVAEDDEVMWMKLTTDNLLRISCLGKDETANSDMVILVSDSTGREAGIAEPDGVVSSLVTTVIRSPTPSK
ncbi:heterokaryon incompatibility protein-domain-containing protein [Butyriboletus roseoflavus]|nr:heterokaryon incompatibility protein-domain-containing protein [Butyriboletus roseoflavus]